MLFQQKLPYKYIQYIQNRYLKLNSFQQCIPLLLLLIKLPIFLLILDFFKCYLIINIEDKCMHFDCSVVPPIESVTKNYQVLSKLGEGTFACVYRVKDKRTQINYAIKQIAAHPLVIEEQLKQIQNLSTLLNDHIIKLHDYFYDKQENYLNLVMQLATGSLRSELRTKDYTNKQLISFIVQMVSAFSELNNKKMMHLDLKPENILVVAGEGNYKICDFGSSQIAQRSQISKYGNQAFGTFNYLAPENYLPYEGIRTNFSADIWSLGIILYQMIFKKLPFKLQKNGTVKIQEMEAYFSGDESVINYLKPYRTENTDKFVKLLKLMLKSIPPQRISWVGLRDLLIQDFGVGKYQFLDVCAVFPKHLTLLSIFLTILLLIRKNQEYNPHEFWTGNTKLLSGLTNILLHLTHLYSLKFNNYYGYKLKSELRLEERQNLQFMAKNIEYQQQTLSKKTGENIPTLELIESLQNSLKQKISICKQGLMKHTDNFWEAMRNLDIFCDETIAVGKKGSFFLCGEKQNYSKTIQALEIVI